VRLTDDAAKRIARILRRCYCAALRHDAASRYRLIPVGREVVKRLRQRRRGSHQALAAEFMFLDSMTKALLNLRSRIRIDQPGAPIRNSDLRPCPQA
jgi:hypothetical protein